jgi:hypothetical protein
MVDAEESENWRADPALREGLDFRKGDFSDEMFMKSIAQTYDLAMAYDVLPHQIDLRHTLSLMLSKTKRFFLISNPVIPDAIMSYRNSLILLSGSRSPKLIPFHEQWTKEIDYWRNFTDSRNVERSHWLWGMSPSFIESLMAGLGWQVVHKEIWRDPFLQNQRWRMGGIVFTRSAAE